MPPGSPTRSSWTVSAGSRSNATSSARSAEQGELGDRRELLTGRQLHDPDEVVAIARAAERELDMSAAPNVRIFPDRTPPAACGERRWVAIGQRELDLV